MRRKVLTNLNELMDLIDEDPDTALANMIADLNHWCDSLDIPFHDGLHRGLDVYEEELREHQAAEDKTPDPEPGGGPTARG